MTTALPTKTQLSPIRVLTSLESGVRLLSEILPDLKNLPGYGQVVDLHQRCLAEIHPPENPRLNHRTPLLDDAYLATHAFLRLAVQEEVLKLVSLFHDIVLTANADLPLSDNATGMSIVLQHQERNQQQIVYGTMKFVSADLARFIDAYFTITLVFTEPDGKVVRKDFYFSHLMKPKLNIQISLPVWRDNCVLSVEYTDKPNPPPHEY